MDSVQVADMRIRAIVTCLCIALPTVGGCNSWRAWRRPASPAAPQDEPIDRPGASDTENASLKSRNIILEARLSELQAREERLAAEVNRLRFLVRQQAKQIDALADAPEQRDIYKKRYESLLKKVARLSRQIDELEAETRPAPTGTD